MQWEWNYTYMPDDLCMYRKANAFNTWANFADVGELYDVYFNFPSLS